MKCPLCKWVFDQKPLDPRISADTLASVFGRGIMLQTALNKQADETERALADHFKTHTVVEWVKKVTDQQQQIVGLQARLEQYEPIPGSREWMEGQLPP